MDRTQKKKNDTIYESLDVNFTAEQAMQQSIVVKGTGVTNMAVQQMLKNWRRQGPIVPKPNKRYQKISSCV